ncbi:hypothetical protein CIRG_06981 [Coccidioides immitis RMSCC 2394]|uniref:Uncharacterized protein n=1 Tax=Coccidioides immitis RMSCC 2394 TaxID=404692 RepID=A0A0J6YI57_COCIT|nr:hypothetical protein CIRG_06981 [Coccidioides immitis RMSCC 2394]
MATATSRLGADSPLPDRASANARSDSATNQRVDDISLSFVPTYRFMTPTFSPCLRPPKRVPQVPPPFPETPTPPARPSARSRARSWAAAAVKTVKSVEVLRSRKSSVALKKGADKRRGSTSELGDKYHLISIAHSTPRSFSSGAINLRDPYKDIPPLPSPWVDKALPSEKPLPQTPGANSEPNLSPVTSRSLIDAEERPLCWSPPGMPGVKEDWPILAPTKATESLDSEISRSQLTPMAPMAPENVERGVRMFNDAANRLAGSFGTVPIPPQDSTSMDNEVSITTDASSPRQPVSTTPEPGTVNISKASAFNPFRSRSRASDFPGSSPTTPVNRNFSYTFDSQRRGGMTDSCSSSKGEKREIFSGRGSIAEDLPSSGRKSSASKIPRVSPAVSPSSPTFPSGVESRPMSPLLSPTPRSSIPLPSRFLRSHRSEQAPIIPARKASTTFGKLEKSIVPAAGKSTQPEMVKSTGHDTSVELGLASDTEESDPGAKVDTEYITEEGVRVKQLSHASPSGGPQLRISPEAEKVIMGDDNTQPSENKRNSAQRLWRLENRRELRMSTDSLFGGFGMKRDGNPRARSSLGNVSTPDSPPKDAALTRIPTVKSADLSVHSPSPPGNDQGSKKLVTMDVGSSPVVKTSNNPFFNKVLSKSSSFTVREECKNQKYVQNNFPCSAKSPQKHEIPQNGPPKGDSARKDSPQHIKKNEFSPSKIKRTPERLELRKHSHVVRRESPRISRPHEAPNRFPDKFGRPHLDEEAYQSKLRAVRMTPMPVTAQDTDHTQGIRCRDGASQGRHSHLHALNHASQDSTKQKVSGTKGVLSNFRGLFTKHKAEPIKENPAPTPSGQRERLSRKSKASLHGRRSIARSPVRYYQAIFGTDREVQASHELQNRDVPVSANNSFTPVAPAFVDTREVSGLAMEVLDSARTEPDTRNKERLVKLGSFLIEAVNNSNDAEKAMITAIQAAKQAEISCALAKENALRIGRVAREWLGETINGTRA